MTTNTDPVRALLAKWRRQAAEHGTRTFTGNDHALFANELEAALASAPPSAPEVDGLPINDAVPAPTQIQPGNLFLWNWTAMQKYGRACIAHAIAQQPAAVDEAMVFRLAVWMAKHDGHDDPHHLIWEGSPPEPWGEVWNRYEDDARDALTAALAAQQQGGRADG